MAPHSDALVFFGATGDLAYKKIFPALQAMVKHGHLDVPVIGVAKAGWDLDQLKARARDSLEEARRRRRGGLRQALRPAALRRRRLQRPGDVPGPPQGARRGPAPGALPRHPAQPVRHGRRATRQVGLRRGRPGHRREAVRPRPGIGAGAQQDPAEQLRRDGDLPHRPLPRQDAGAEPALLPLRQLVPGADLEPPTRRERADHDGGGVRRPGPRGLLRRRPARSATWSRTTCSRCWPTWRWSRRPGPTASRSATRR